MIKLVQYLWLIPALPLAAAGLSALAKQRSRKWAAALAIGAMVLAFFLSCAAFVQTLGDPGERTPAGEAAAMGHTATPHPGPLPSVRGEGAPASAGPSERSAVTTPHRSVRQVHKFDWFVLGETSLKLGWVLDPLTAAMLLMITFVGLLIFIYSVGYMAEDENFTRFFCFLSLFAAAMLGLVIANSLLLLFICWELVGLASYLLIGFWYRKPSAAAAAKKAFITTRVGDVFFFLGLLWLYAQTGTLLFYDGGNGCLEQGALAKLVGQSTALGMAVSTAISLLIFCGAIGKSGQVPLHVWLPDAMEGPTPVSALIHAATMVAAGVFLVARVEPLMATLPVTVGQASSLSRNGVLPAQHATAQGPETNRAAAIVKVATEGQAGSLSYRGDDPIAPRVSTALQAVTWVGAITALFAALIAVAQTDIKRILAYSTVSQLGFMFMGLGAGGVAVGMFHLLTHAFFKALLFLGAGSVIHGCHGEQDIRHMGDLRKFMPLTFATYAVGMMALAGVPLFFAGFWSKDEILHAAALWPSKWPFLLGLAGAFLTAFYMMRQVWHVFFGQSRTGFQPVLGGTSSTSSHSSPHESPPVMTIPLAVLAVCTVLLSVFGTPVWPWLHSYLSGHGAHIQSSIAVSTLLVMLLSAAIALGGIALGWWLYSRRSPAAAEDLDPLERFRPDIFAVLRRKFFIDELYQVSVVRWNDGCARAARWLDEKLWNGVVMSVSYAVLALAWLNRLIDEFIVNLGFDRGCGGLRRGAGLVSLWQNGQVQRYLRVIGLGLAIFALAFIWGCR